jgi:hypothetical protein
MDQGAIEATAGREVAGLEEVHVVQRATLDGLYGFVDERQADEYAALFEGAERGTLTVLDARQGAALVERERAEQAEDQPASVVGEGPGWHWVGYVDAEGWPLGGNEPCDCEEGADHVEQR